MSLRFVNILFSPYLYLYPTSANQNQSSSVVYYFRRISANPVRMKFLFSLITLFFFINVFSQLFLYLLCLLNRFFSFAWFVYVLYSALRSCCLFLHFKIVIRLGLLTSVPFYIRVSLYLLLFSFCIAFFMLLGRVWYRVTQYYSKAKKVVSFTYITLSFFLGCVLVCVCANVYVSTSWLMDHIFSSFAKNVNSVLSFIVHTP